MSAVIDRLQLISDRICMLAQDPDLISILELIVEELEMLRGRTETSDSFIKAVRTELQR